MIPETMDNRQKTLKNVIIVVVVIIIMVFISVASVGNKDLTS